MCRRKITREPDHRIIQVIVQLSALPEIVGIVAQVHLPVRAVILPVQIFQDAPLVLGAFSGAAFERTPAAPDQMRIFQALVDGEAGHILPDHVPVLRRDLTRFCLPQLVAVHAEHPADIVLLPVNPARNACAIPCEPVPHHIRIAELDDVLDIRMLHVEFDIIKHRDLIELVDLRILQAGAFERFRIIENRVGLVLKISHARLIPCRLGHPRAVLPL